MWPRSTPLAPLIFHAHIHIRIRIRPVPPLQTDSGRLVVSEELKRVFRPCTSHWQLPPPSRLPAARSPGVRSVSDDEYFNGVDFVSDPFIMPLEEIAAIVRGFAWQPCRWHGLLIVALAPPRLCLLKASTSLAPRGNPFLAEHRKPKPHKMKQNENR